MVELLHTKIFCLKNSLYICIVVFTVYCDFQSGREGREEVEEGVCRKRRESGVRVNSTTGIQLESDAADDMSSFNGEK